MHSLVGSHSGSLIRTLTLLCLEQGVDQCAVVLALLVISGYAGSSLLQASKVSAVAMCTFAGVTDSLQLGRRRVFWVCTA